MNPIEVAPSRLMSADGWLRASVGGVEFELSGYLPAPAGETGPADPGEEPSSRYRIRSRAISRPHPRLLDPYHPVPMEWKLQERVIRIDGRSFAADIDLDALPEREISFWAVDDDPEAFHPSLSNLFRILLAAGRIVPSLLLVHSSSVVVNGRAALLYGRSEAGKTTSGRLARSLGYEVPSDDLNVVDVPAGDGPVLVQGFPFSGDFGRRSWVPEPQYELGAILRLEKADAAGISRLSPALALAGMASCAAFMNGEPSLQGELLGLLSRLISRVPVFTLRFSMDTGFLPVLEEVLAA